MPTSEGPATKMPSGGRPDTLTVAIIEDQKEIRAGLQMLIHGSPGFRCVGAHASMEEGLQNLAAEDPKIVLLDIGLPGISGTEGIPRLRQKYPHSAILILTVYHDDHRPGFPHY